MCICSEIVSKIYLLIFIIDNQHRWTLVAASFHCFIKVQTLCLSWEVVTFISEALPLRWAPLDKKKKKYIRNIVTSPFVLKSSTYDKCRLVIYNSSLHVVKMEIDMDVQTSMCYNLYVQCIFLYCPNTNIF